MWAELPHSTGGRKGQQDTDIAVLSSVWQAAVPEVQSLDPRGNEEVAATSFKLEEETGEHGSRVARIEVHGGARRAQGGFGIFGGGTIVRISPPLPQKAWECRPVLARLRQKGSVYNENDSDIHFDRVSVRPSSGACGAALRGHRSETRVDLFIYTALMERGHKSVSVEPRDSYYFICRRYYPFLRCAVACTSFTDER